MLEANKKVLVRTRWYKKTRNKNEKKAGILAFPFLFADLNNS
jgi:hypothetical protein